MNMEVEKKEEGKQYGRRMKKVIYVFFNIIMLLIVVAFTYYWVKSPGKLIQYTDGNGNVVENSFVSKEYIEINGTKLGMIIKSKDLSHPVLLILHGGVGMPEYPMTYVYPTGIEEQFTVVWIEQRGAGLSFDSKIKPEEITTEQSISDAIEVSKYLCKRFNTEKIYLMALSGGTYTGIRAVNEAPELYYAYIGMSQIVDDDRSKEIACDYMIDYFTQLGKMDRVKMLKNARGTEKFSKTVHKLLFEAGLETTRTATSEFQGIFLPAMESPEYTLGEKINIWRGLILNKRSPLSKDAGSQKIEELNTKYEVPIYLLSGKYDYICTSELSKEFFEKIEAPDKAFYIFEESAHTPIFEEPDKVNEALKEILKRTKAIKQ